MIDTGSPDSHRFDFDLDRGIREQVVQKLEQLQRLPLAKNVGPEASGVYVLYLGDHVVYVGKASKGTTKSKRTLRARLNEHLQKIDSRKGIAPSDVQCQYLTFSSEWWVFAAEFALITHFSPDWNSSGFGSKTPGKGRPGTDRISTWDSMYPKKTIN